MTRRYYANAAPQQTLSAQITSAATTLQVADSFTGWPSSTPFFAVLEYGTANMEIVLVTGITGTTATVTRGQNGTAAVSHLAGSTLDHGVVAQDVDEASAHINATSGVHGLAGGLVGLNDTQTLTNKTLTSPTVTTPTVTGGLHTDTLVATGAVSGASGAFSGAVSGASLAGILEPTVYANATARDAAITTPTAGMVVYLTSPGTLMIYSGTAWTPITNGPHAVLYQSAVQSIPNGSGTFTAVAFDQSVVDTYSGHSNTVNNTRYTAPLAGWYTVTGQVAYSPNGMGLRAARLQVNGAATTPTFEVEDDGSASATAVLDVSGYLFLNVGDYVELATVQSTGAAANLLASFTSMTVRWVHS